MDAPRHRVNIKPLAWGALLLALNGCGARELRVAAELESRGAQVGYRDAVPQGRIVTAVDLSGLPDAGPLLAMMRDLPHLEWLNLREAIFERADLESIHDCPLTYLDLFGTPVDDRAMESVGRLSQLKWLSVANTNVGDEGLTEVARLTHLETLAVGPSTTDEGLRHLAACRHLQTLYLGRTRVRGHGLAFLTRLPELRELWLDETAVNDEGLAFVARLPHLQRLGLSSTPISDQALIHLRRLEHLDYLSLADTSVSDRGLDILAQFPALFILDIPRTRVTPEGIRAFQSRCPDVRVGWSETPDDASL